MKIKSIEVFTFKYDHHYRIGGHTDAPNRLPGTDYYFESQWQHAYSRQTESCLVKITTDAGVAGWGECQAPLVPEVPATLIARLLGPSILGLDVDDNEAIYHRLYHLNHARGHTTSFTIDAITGIDLAIWDIKGKTANRPIQQLLDNDPLDSLPLYVSGLRRPTLEERQSYASEIINKGFKGIKLFQGNTPKACLQEFEQIRKVIGDKPVLALDAICSQNFQHALQIGAGLDELNAAWFEAPMNPEDIADHSILAQQIKTPVAIGEMLRTVREFEPWIQQKGMGIAQPDIVRSGITGGLRIIEQAQKNHLQVGLHIGVCTAIGIAATWHIASVLKNPVLQEHQLDMFATANKVVKQPLVVENGNAIVPVLPGLGIEVDEEFVRKHSSNAWLVSI